MRQGIACAALRGQIKAAETGPKSAAEIVVKDEGCDTVGSAENKDRLHGAAAAKRGRPKQGCTVDTFENWLLGWVCTLTGSDAFRYFQVLPMLSSPILICLKPLDIS